jgi:hypothetical protein
MAAKKKGRRDAVSLSGAKSFSRSGCSNWYDIVIVQGTASSEEDCLRQCQAEPGCNFMNFQFDDCGDWGNQANACYLYSGNCEVEDNYCWDLWQVDMPLPAQFHRNATRMGCSNYVQIETGDYNMRVMNPGQCSKACGDNPWCKGFNFQPVSNEACAGSGQGRDQGACLLFVDDCVQERNSCWDYYSRVREPTLSDTLHWTQVVLDVSKYSDKVGVESPEFFVIGQDIQIHSYNNITTRRVVNIVYGQPSVLVVSPVLTDFYPAGSKVVRVTKEAVQSGKLQNDERCPAQVEDVNSSTCTLQDYYYCAYDMTNCADANGTTISHQYQTVTRCSQGTVDTTTSTLCPAGSATQDAFKSSAIPFWNCNGHSCDKATLKPWDPAKFISPAAYSPQDPFKHGGPWYGEKMWLVGRVSEVLSKALGPDSGFCGSEGQGGSPGCGKCFLIQNPGAVNSDWQAVVMKKGTCSASNNVCLNRNHSYLAVPGFDDSGVVNSANVCGQPGTGLTVEQSKVAGQYHSSVPGTPQYANTIEAMPLCDKLPEGAYRDGCKLFASWGWRRHQPDDLVSIPVPCPKAFQELISRSFGATGVNG